MAKKDILFAKNLKNAKDQKIEKDLEKETKKQKDKEDKEKNPGKKKIFRVQPIDENNQTVSEEWVDIPVFTTVEFSDKTIDLNDEMLAEVNEWLDGEKSKDYEFKHFKQWYREKYREQLVKNWDGTLKYPK
jgi:hypothetical protein